MTEKLKVRIDKLEKNLMYANIENQSISQRGVDWHIDHSLKVILGVLMSLEASNNKEYKYKFNFLRTFCLTFSYLPRGKARAPKVVNNLNQIQISELKKQIELSRVIINNLDSFDSKSNFKHPYFGVLNLKQSLKFLDVHTKHHLKIIDEIKNG